MSRVVHKGLVLELDGGNGLELESKSPVRLIFLWFSGCPCFKNAGSNL